MDLIIKEYRSGDFDKCVEPSGGEPNWQLLIDRDGIPHLLLRCIVETSEGLQYGWVAMDDFLPEGSGIRDILEGTFREEDS